MANIMMPQKKSGGGLGKLVGIGSTIAGVATGNPMMTAGGIASLSGSQKAQGLVGAAGAVTNMMKPSDLSPKMQNQVKTLQQAEMILPELPDNIRQEIAPALGTAMAMTVKDIRSGRA